jgi:glycosyltransferase involved in cell wall biosynthesis
MHIAIDGKRFFLNTSGLGRYSRSLVNSLLSLDDEAFLLTLFRPKGRVFFEAPTHRRLRIVTADYVLPGDAGNALWRFTKFPRLINKKKYSVFHGPSHILPGRLDCPAVVTMLDLIFLRFPQYFPVFDRQYYKIMFKKSARQADHIISISQATQFDLVSYFGIDADKISVVYPAFDDMLTPVGSRHLSKIRLTYALPKIYVLYVGTIEPRKNILRLAQAFDSLMVSGKIDQETALVIAGRKGWFYKEIFAGISKLKSRRKIRFLGPVYGPSLAGLYQMATAMAYPSLFEGFGYPVLEAMRLGTPVLTSNVSSLPEAGGPAAVLIEPEQVDDIAFGLAKILNDETVRAGMIRKGLEHASQFTAERMARQTLSIYKRFVR